MARLENLNILQLQDARKTHFPTFSMIWATFCTHLNHCYLYVLFISQPQSTNFEQNLTRSLHFIVGSAMKKSLVTDSAGWCFSVYSASTRIQNAQTERRKLLRICNKK